MQRIKILYSGLIGNAFKIRQFASEFERSFDILFIATGKVGYNDGKWTFGFGFGEVAGAIVKYDPSTKKPSVNSGITTELKVTTKVKMALGKLLKVGSSIEASARADQAGNYQNKVKADIGKAKLGDASGKVSYEIGEKGNINDVSNTKSYTKISGSAEASAGAFQFVGAEVEVSGSLKDLKK